MLFDLKEAYPEFYRETHDPDAYVFGPYDYGPMISLFGEAIVRVDDENYQGDTRVLLRDNHGKHGVLLFGWGSCSGCDALQGCKSWKDLEELTEEVRSQIVWFDYPDEAIQWIKSADWESKAIWFYREKETRAFISACLGYLGSIREVP